MTFAYPPLGRTQQELLDESRDLLSPFTKAKYGVDSYLVILEPNDIPGIIDQVVYWNSLWSHDRLSQWKGYLQVDLSDTEDASAMAVLANPGGEGGTQ
ncbi:MAG: hypothetical protein OXI51_03060 [Chloroflexota bacterium]|nr:hypothetical protein [Chloroflexota bacterium]